MSAPTNPSQLAAALTHAAHTGSWGEEAAVRLLIAQGHWLRQADFSSHVNLDEDIQGRRTAWIDWPALAQVPDRSPASTGEQAVLRLACHLAGHLPANTDERWTIADIVSRLDAINAVIASRAVAMTALGPDAVGPLS